ncbi:MAG: cytochrome c3 family protein [Candidatus Methylomirabilia bacterium]
MTAAVCAGAGRNHPTVTTGAGCVTGQCHARLLEAATGSVHLPASGDDCAACHDLSLEPATRFVRGAPAGGSDDPESARAWDLALCAGCHGEGLLAPNAQAATTGFADGKRNLHALHVQAGRGRRCLPCHDPHASRQAKLLRERIQTRGKARIAQEFRGEPRGGWCKTGCHAPKRYKR